MRKKTETTKGACSSPISMRKSQKKVRHDQGK
jgi:hypothetical protein